MKNLITCGIFLYQPLIKKFLICHATKARWNQWSIPKGIMDEGENEYTAAKRELYEETGIDPEELDLLHVEALPPVTYKKSKKELHSFLIITEFDENIKLICRSLVKDSYPEIDKFKWAKFEELEDVLHEAQVTLLKEIKSKINDYELLKIRD